MNGYFYAILFALSLSGCSGGAEVFPLCEKVNISNVANINKSLTAIEKFASNHDLHLDDRSDSLSRLMQAESVFITFNDGPPITKIIILKNIGEGFILEGYSEQPDNIFCHEFIKGLLPTLQNGS